MSPHDEPLTPEERDLARRLARVDAAAEPSPALDARILAAARGATGAAPAVVRQAPAKRRPRFAWAAGLGVAASLLLAVGIAWQLRPQPDASVQYSEAPAAAATARDEEPLAEVRAPDAFPASPPPPPPPPQQPKSVSSEPAASAPAREARARRQFSPPPQEPREKQAETAESGRAETPMVFNEPSPVDTPAPPAEAPAPPAPAPRAAEAASEPQPDLSALSSIDAAGAVTQEIANERERKARAEEASRDAAKQRRDDSLDRIHEETDEDAGFDDQPYDEEPPASADSPEVRTAWLSRIRELLGEGKVDAARASLAEFHRRYPEAPLPDDLRSLLE
jgi:hypothetical protein